MAWGLFIAKPSGRTRKHAIPIHHSGTHPVLGLLRILLALVLRNRSQHILHEDGV